MKTTVTLLVCLTLASGLVAQNVGNWTFNNTLNGSASTGANVSVMTVGSSIPLLTTNNSIEYYGEGGWPSGALDPNAYLQFTVNANSGYYLVLNKVILSMRRSSTGSPMGSGPNSWTLRSSLDGYASDLGSGSGLDYNIANFTVNLPAAFQAIASTVTFRLYGYNMTLTSSGLNRFVWDNVSVQGSAMSGVLATQSVNLSARQGDGGVSLRWAAAGFDNGTVLRLERSSNGTDFTSVYRVLASEAGSYEDRGVSGRLYYRMRASNADGSEYISPVVALSSAGTSGMRIRAVSAQGGSVRALVHVEDGGAYQLGVWSQDGKMLVRRALNGMNGDAAADVVVGDLPHGVYVMTLAGDAGRVSKAFVL